MNRMIYKKLSLVAVLLAAITPSAALMAEASPKVKADMAQPAPSPLEAATMRLKELAKDIDDPELLKAVNIALKRARFVMKAGPEVTAEHAEKALGSVQKVLAVADAKKKMGKHHSESHKSCNARKEISEIESEFDECCQDIKKELTELVTLVNAQFPCDATTPIYTVPIVINEPGKYCVVNDLVYNGTASAILVKADNVSINFQNHSLTLTDSNAQGIHVLDVNEFELQNDVIKGSAIFKTSTSAAVHLENVNKATLKNIYTKNTTKGIEIENSSNVRVEFSQVEAHEGVVQLVFPSPATLAGTGNGAGIWIEGSQGVTVDSCAFVGADLVFDPSRTSFGLHVEGSSENITLTNSTFTDWLGSIHVLNVNGMLIDHCVAIASPVSNLNLVQLGSCDAENKANDVIIRNSNFVQHTAVQGFDGILAVGGSGCLFENLLIDTVSDDIPNGYLPSAIHIGSTGCDAFENLLAKNCIVKGVNGRTIHIENGVKAIFDACQISGGTNVNILMNAATDCAIKNSMVHDGDNGIFIDTPSGAGKNSIENCLVYDNTVWGIEVADKNHNHLSGNSVWGSRVGIEISYPAFNEVFYNTCCNNSVHNCTNITAFQVPGDTPAFAGSNVCCNPQ